MSDTLRKLENAATPAPWVADDYDVLTEAYDPREPVFTGSGSERVSEDDAALIVALRNAAPLLLDVVDAARALRDVPKRYPDDSDWLPLHRALAALDAVE